MWFDSACQSAKLGVGAEESKSVGLGGARDERRFRRVHAEKISGSGVGCGAGGSYGWRGGRAGSNQAAEVAGSSFAKRTESRAAESSAGGAKSECRVGDRDRFRDGATIQ